MDSRYVIRYSKNNAFENLYKFIELFFIENSDLID